MKRTKVLVVAGSVLLGAALTLAIRQNHKPAQTAAVAVAAPPQERAAPVQPSAPPASITPTTVPLSTAAKIEGDIVASAPVSVSWATRHPGASAKLDAVNSDGLNNHQKMLAGLEPDPQPAEEPIHSTLAEEISTPSYEATVQALHERSADLLARAGVKRQQLLAQANSARIATSIPGYAGNPAATLADITDSGEPIYLSPNNVTAAATVGVNKLWPTNSITALPIISGQSGLNLSGSNQLIGMWEVPYFTDGSSSIQTNHNQFSTSGGGSRVLMGDADFNPTGISPHATAVAGTLAGSGVNDVNGTVNFGNWSRGASYKAAVHAYAVYSGLGGTFSDEAANGLRIANNSYGQNAGWVFNGVWFWYGPTNTGVLEDWKFGAYMGVSPDGSGAAARELDDDAMSAPNALMVFSAGNSGNQGPGSATNYFYPGNPNPQTTTRDWDNGDQGGYDSLPPSACAKNVLSVGAVYTITPEYTDPTNVILAPFSSYGPTDDGRIKPEVVAAGIRSTNVNSYNPFGFGGLVSAWWDPNFSTVTSNYVSIAGTSFSAPSVAGALGLVLERRHQIRPEWAANSYPIRSSTLRALSVHTAKPATTNAGPSFKFGYGLFDAVGAVNLMAADASTGGGTGAKPYVKEVQLIQSQVVQFAVHATNPAVPLKVTIAWTDVPGPSQTLNTIDQTTKRLVNDLDLRVYPPGTNVYNANASTTAKPYVLNPDLAGKTSATRSGAATTGDDATNNLEQVVVNSPSTNGTYTVRVTNKGTLSGGNPQWVSIIISGSDVPAVNFTITSFVRQPDGSFIIDWSAVVGGVYALQTASSILGPWIDASSEISANLETMSLLIPPPTDDMGFFRFVRIY